MVMLLSGGSGGKFLFFSRLFALGSKLNSPIPTPTKHSFADALFVFYLRALLRLSVL